MIFGRCIGRISSGHNGCVVVLVFSVSHPIRWSDISIRILDNIYARMTTHYSTSEQFVDVDPSLQAFRAETMVDGLPRAYRSVPRWANMDGCLGTFEHVFGTFPTIRFLWDPLITTDHMTRRAFSF